MLKYARYLAIALSLFSVGAGAVPHDVMLVLDNSGSMRKIDRDLLAKSAALDFLTRLPADFRAGVILFDENARLIHALTELNDASKAEITAGLAGMNYRGNYTDGPAAIERAMYELQTKGRAEALKSIVFVSDGDVDTGDKTRDTERRQWLRVKLAKEAAEQGIRIVPIAFTENADVQLIEDLAGATNGVAVRAIQPADLAGAYAQLLERLQTLTALAPVAPPVPEPPPAVVPAPPEVAPVPAPSAPEAPPPAPTAAAPTVEPAPPPVEVAPPPPPAPAPGPALQGEMPALTAEERAALEQLAKDTGVPVEQLMKELENAPAGQAVVVQPDEAPAAPASGISTTALLAAIGGLGVLVAGVVWWLSRRKRETPVAAAVSAIPVAPAVQGKAAEAFLIDINGVTTESARRITERQLIVGRTAGSDTEFLDYFVINKATVGRRHAIIKYKDHAFWLVDQGSVNGTFVNNERLLGERLLRHGDRIKFHKFEFEFSYPEMADANRTVVGISGDQTIVASQDSTMSATSASLRRDTTRFTAGAAAASSGTEAWLNEGALANVPGQVAAGDPFDVTKEGDLDSLEADKNAFFGGNDPHALAAEPRAIVADGDDTFDDDGIGTVARAGMVDDEPQDDEDDFGVDVNLDVLEEMPTSAPLSPTAVAGRSDFDAEASAFFDDITVGPSPDLMKNVGRDDVDMEVLDITKVPGVGDDESTHGFAPPATVMRSPGERTGTKPPLDTGSFGELTTIARDLENDGVSVDDFIDTGSFDNPTLVPQSPRKVGGSDISVDEFISTGMFDGKQLTNEDTTLLPPSAQADDIFDVTGTDDIPSQETVVLENPPHPKKGGPDERR